MNTLEQEQAKAKKEGEENVKAMLEVAKLKKLGNYKTYDIKDLQLCEFNRAHFDQAVVEDLAMSIFENGWTQPLDIVIIGKEHILTEGNTRKKALHHLTKKSVQEDLQKATQLPMTEVQQRIIDLSTSVPAMVVGKTKEDLLQNLGRDSEASKRSPVDNLLKIREAFEYAKTAKLKTTASEIGRLCGMRGKAVQSYIDILRLPAPEIDKWILSQQKYLDTKDKKKVPVPLSQANMRKLSSTYHKARTEKSKVAGEKALVKARKEIIASRSNTAPKMLSMTEAKALRASVTNELVDDQDMVVGYEYQFATGVDRNEAMDLFVSQLMGEEREETLDQYFEIQE